MDPKTSIWNDSKELIHCCGLKFNIFIFFLGYTLEAQKSLFDNIRPLFANKPLIVIANKKDVWGDNLTEEKKAILTSFETELVTMTMIEN